MEESREEAICGQIAALLGVVFPECVIEVLDEFDDTIDRMKKFVPGRGDYPSTHSFNPALIKTIQDHLSSDGGVEWLSKLPLIWKVIVHYVAIYGEDDSKMNELCGELWKVFGFAETAEFPHLMNNDFDKLPGTDLGMILVSFNDNVIVRQVSHTSPHEFVEFSMAIDRIELKTAFMRHQERIIEAKCVFEYLIPDGVDATYLSETGEGALFSLSVGKKNAYFVADFYASRESTSLLTAYNTRVKLDRVVEYIGNTGMHFPVPTELYTGELHIGHYNMARSMSKKSSGGLSGIKAYPIAEYSGYEMYNISYKGKEIIAFFISGDSAIIGNVPLMRCESTDGDGHLGVWESSLVRALESVRMPLFSFKEREVYSK